MRLSGAGTLPDCPYMGCGFKCCTIEGGDEGNYIVTYPGEWEAVAPDDRTHLTILDDDYMGGKKVVCVASDCATCDGGYKPADCAFYPLFPRTSPRNLRGSKCPLEPNMLWGHTVWVNEQFAAFPSHIQDWFDRVRLIGYEYES